MRIPSLWPTNCWATILRWRIGGASRGRAAGNPFFAEEMVRDLAERGVLDGEPGAYCCAVTLSTSACPPPFRRRSVPASTGLAAAKQTLNAASVIGLVRHGPDGLVADADVGPLMEAELVDQVEFTDPWCTRSATR